MPSRLLLVLFTLLLLGGCASAPSAPFAVPSAPEDFSVDLTIRPGIQYVPPPSVHLQPGRFVLFPDGSLHHDRSGDPGRLPEQVRTLDRREVEDLWTRIGELGFRDDGRNLASLNFTLVEPPLDGIVYLIEIAAGDERRAFVIFDDADDAQVQAAAALVRTLAHYAWASDEPQSIVRMRPLRYDFGPDPYARYRTVEDNEELVEDSELDDP